MSRRRRVAFVCLAGVVASGIAQLIDPGGAAAALCLLASGVVLGELLVLRVEDGSAIPLSYAVLVVLASSFTLPQYTIAVLVAEVVSTLVCMTDRSVKRRLATFVERITVAAATYAGYRLTWYLIPVAQRETVAGVLGALAVAALVQVIADVAVRRVLHQGTTFSPRGRLAWLAIASSGMLMAIGYRGVNGDGRVGIWGPLLFSTPLLAAWYAFERLDSATRSYHQTIEALAMAPELGGLVPDGHAQRVAELAIATGDQLGLPAQDIRDLEMAALLHHLGQVTLDEPEDPVHHLENADVAAVTGAMLRDIRPLAGAGDIVAGDSDDPRRRLAVQVLRVVSEFDDLTVRDNVPSSLAIESLRSAPAYVYDERVMSALERALGRRVDA